MCSKLTTLSLRCAKITSLGLGKEQEYVCGMVGQYVTVTIPGRAGYLTLCEVKVYGKDLPDNYEGRKSIKYVIVYLQISFPS